MIHDEIVQLIRQAVAQSTNPDDVVRMRVVDLRDLLDAYDFYLENRGSSDLWMPDHVKANRAPFTKRLERLRRDAEAAEDAMTKLFKRVEPEGRAHLIAHFGHVVRAMRKCADEMMAVHREHFECKPKENA